LITGELLRCVPCEVGRKEGNKKKEQKSDGKFSATGQKFPPPFEGGNAGWDK
jgi:hypothetical protein